MQKLKTYVSGVGNGNHPSILGRYASDVSRPRASTREPGPLRHEKIALTEGSFRPSQGSIWLTEGTDPVGDRQDQRAQEIRWHWKDA